MSKIDEICVCGKKVVCKKLCEACYARNRYRSDPKFKEQRKATYRRNHVRIAEQRKSPGQKFKSSLLKAKYKGVVWEVSESEYFNLMEKNCYYCDQTFSEYGISLDRLDNKKGYTINNVVTCCGECNSIRSNILTPEEMKVGMNAIMEYRKCQK